MQWREQEQQIPGEERNIIQTKTKTRRVSYEIAAVVQPGWQAFEREYCQLVILHAAACQSNNINYAYLNGRPEKMKKEKKT